MKSINQHFEEVLFGKFSTLELSLITKISSCGAADSPISSLTIKSLIRTIQVGDAMIDWPVFSGTTVTF